ncbi:hypothetical protein [Flavobacterium wongokense]|uniref:hypothetical protein n=1 Tax=Flavobacterium wongokense TaxID=2910674 RepID=UPI001F34E469|nr:hypothetical protein [Flavobacterium sp. WG47]MCF6132416.1 hypothetical protein [Flavobacterium sp. WG47]
MKKTFRILPLLLFLLLIDRFMFLPGRMDGIWQYDNGVFMGDPITYDDIVILNNFEIQISKSGKLHSCYLLGCYFGNLFLLDTYTLQYTRYIELKESNFLSTE